MTLTYAEGECKLDTSKYSILKNREAINRAFNRDFKVANLTDSEIIEIEHLLTISIEKYNNGQKKYLESLKKTRNYVLFDTTNLLIDPTKYKKQIVAIINSTGQREVWVNCFRPSTKSDYSYWRQTIVYVNDGGNRFFNVKVNLTTKKYHDLRVNGD